MIRVATVDDHPLFLDGVSQSLRCAPDIELVGSGQSSADAIRIGVDLAPDVLVLDMSMPSPNDGLMALEALAARAPEVRVLMLTVVTDEERVVEAIRKGASGYVPKGIAGGELIKIVRTLAAGEAYVAPTLTSRPASRFGRLSWPTSLAGAAQKPLGRREEEILALIARGFSNKLIGDELGLSEKTVKHYVTGLLQKLHVHNRTEAAIVAMNWHVSDVRQRPEGVAAAE